MDLPLVLYRWDNAKSDTDFLMNSSLGENITNKEYLGHGEGKGGQIVGFLEYNPAKEDPPESLSQNFPSIVRSRDRFALMGGKKDLIVINPEHLQRLVRERKIVHVILPASHEEALAKCINTDTSIIKHAKLGGLMGVNANDAEHNFVGDHTFKVSVLRDAVDMGEEEIREFMEGIRSVALRLKGAVNGSVKILDTATADDSCVKTGLKRKTSDASLGTPKSGSEDDGASFLIPIKKPAKKAKGSGKHRKTLRRKRHRRLATRKVARK